MNTSAPAPARPDRPRVWRRRILRGTIALGFVYCAVVGVLLLLEDHLVYLAAPASVSWSAPKKLKVEDVELRSADGTLIHAWWCPKPGARGAVLYCHGQAGNLSHRAGLIERLQKFGNVLIFDYPGFGRSGGRPTEAGCYAAADAAYGWLVEERKIAPGDILLVGKSLGGGIATDLATRRPHRALVLCMTFTDLPAVAQHLIPFVPARLVMRTHFDNLAKISRCRGPVFITHGTADRKIPLEQSQRLFEAAPSPKRFFAMEGVGHGFPFFSDECLEAIEGFLREVERPGLRYGGGE